jgi:hypothetical protein
MTGTALAGLLKHLCFPLAIVLGGIGVYRDKSKYLAAASVTAAIILTGVVYL